jgi:hypothetical protein
MTARSVVVWLVAAVIGLALAAGVTLAASQLSSQHIGLSGEPLSAGNELVPRTTRATPSPATTTEQRDPNESSERGEAPDGDD